MPERTVSKRCILAALLVLLVWFTDCVSASTPDYTKVGVKLGSTADYETSVSWSTENMTHLFVYGIVDTVVYLNSTGYYPNGTVAESSQIIGDVFIGTSFIFLYVTAANLSAGDPIYSGALYLINDTVTMTFAGASRTVNHLRSSDGLLDIYWDRATGLMTKINFWFFGWMNMTIISTDAWEIAPPSAPQNLTATAGNNLVVLQWTAPSSPGTAAITNYKIYRLTYGEYEIWTLLDTAGNVTAYADSSALNGHTYNYTVSAVNDAGEGSKSNVASATPIIPEFTSLLLLPMFAITTMLATMILKRQRRLKFGNFSRTF